MKKKVTLKKESEFPTMIGEISAISLEKDIHFVNENTMEGKLLLKGKYKLTEASRLEEDFYYEIPIEMALVEKIDIQTCSVDITDFTFEIEDSMLICHIELLIDALELIEDEKEAISLELVETEERECDGDPIVENKVEEIQEEVVEDDTKDKESTLFSPLQDDDDTYGTFVVYVLQQNETINTILEKYSTSLEEIEKYNDIQSLTAGTKIIIPLIHE